MISHYEQLFGKRGPGKPANTVEVLPGVGTAQQRSRAKRRAMAILAEEEKERFRAHYRNELIYLAQEDAS